MSDHEKRIRALLDYHANSQCELVAADKADLRALLADLDAVRGALESLCDAPIHTQDLWDNARAALKGASHD